MMEAGEHLIDDEILRYMNTYVIKDHALDFFVVALHSHSCRYLRR